MKGNMIVKLLKQIFPYAWVALWIFIFISIAGDSLNKAPLYVSIPAVVILILLTVVFFMKLDMGKPNPQKQTKTLTNKELGDIIEQIMQETKTQATFNGKEFVGLTEEEIRDKIVERIGTDWKVI